MDLFNKNNCENVKSHAKPVLNLGGKREIRGVVQNYVVTNGGDRVDSVIGRGQNGDNDNGDSSGDRVKELEALTTTSKPMFSCEICSKTFNRKSNMKVHMRVHSGEQPYRCPVCSRPFRRSDSLLRHQITHVKQQLFACFTCELVFTSLEDLAAHKNTHKALEPRQCHESLVPPRHSVLRALLQERTTGQLCQCRMCGAYFKSQVILDYHLDCIHGGVPDCRWALEWRINARQAAQSPVAEAQNELISAKTLFGKCMCRYATDTENHFASPPITAADTVQNAVTTAESVRRDEYTWLDELFHSLV